MTKDTELRVWAKALLNALDKPAPAGQPAYIKQSNIDYIAGNLRIALAGPLPEQDEAHTQRRCLCDPVDFIEQVAKDLRERFGGTKVYIRSNHEVKRAQRTDQILAMHESGASINSIAQRVGVGRATIYRTIKRPGK